MPKIKRSFLKNYYQNNKIIQKLGINIKREFNGTRNSYTEMKINFAKEKRKYFIVGESRFHSAILPKDKTPIEIQDIIKKINI